MEEEFKVSKPSRLWYLFPIFFGLLGGILGYFLIRDRDKKFAKRLIYCRNNNNYSLASSYLHRTYTYIQILLGKALRENETRCCFDRKSPQLF